MNKKIISILLAITLVFSLVLVGCGGDDNGEESSTKSGSNDSGETTADNGNTKEANGIKMDKEQYLNFRVYEPKSLDSTRTSSNTSWAPQTRLFEGLTRIQAYEDGPDEIKPGVAKAGM